MEHKNKASMYISRAKSTQLLYIGNSIARIACKRFKRHFSENNLPLSTFYELDRLFSRGFVTIDMCKSSLDAMNGFHRYANSIKSWILALQAFLDNRDIKNIRSIIRASFRETAFLICFENSSIDDCRIVLANGDVADFFDEILHLIHERLAFSNALTCELQI